MSVEPCMVKWLHDALEAYADAAPEDAEAVRRAAAWAAGGPEGLPRAPYWDVLASEGGVEVPYCFEVEDLLYELGCGYGPDQRGNEHAVSRALAELSGGSIRDCRDLLTQWVGLMTKCEMDGDFRWGCLSEALERGGIEDPGQVWERVELDRLGQASPSLDATAGAARRAAGGQQARPVKTL